MIGNEWEPKRYRDRILYYYRVPFDECPNCNEYEYTTRRKYKSGPGLIFNRNRNYKYKYYEYCSNCELKENVRIEEKE